LIATGVVGSFTLQTISGVLIRESRQKVLWEARLYAEQLQRTVVRIASSLDALASSNLAGAGEAKLLLERLDDLRNKNIGVVQAWVAYPNGAIIASSNAKVTEIRNRPFWKDFLSGKYPVEFFPGFFLWETGTIVSAPFKDSGSGSALVTLISIVLKGSKPLRVGGLDLDISKAVSDDTGKSVNWVWNKAPVNIYSLEGLLIASPLEESRGAVVGLRDDSERPLVHYFLEHPQEGQGTLFYEEDGEKWVGAFVKDSSLGMVITVVRPSEYLLLPMRRVVTIFVMVAILFIAVASILTAFGYSKEIEIRELKYRNKKAELRALQAYINPHFLFNALSRICSLANPRDYHLIPRAIKAIAEIFRYVTKNAGSLVTLREELECVRNYVAIQKLRFGDKFTYQEVVPKELLDATVLKFSVQPLIENCFVHAVEETLEPVEIRLVVERDGNYLKIKVEDNGPGFEPEKLEELQKMLRNATENSGKASPEWTSKIGILNTHYRLYLMYGGFSGITLKQEDGFTVVVATLPFVPASKKTSRPS